MPTCAIHGLYFGGVCPICSGKGNNTITPEPPQQENYEANVKYLTDLAKQLPNVVFNKNLVLQARKLDSGRLLELMRQLACSNKRSGFGNVQGIQGLQQRYEEFSQYSKIDDGHLFMFSDQQYTLMILMAIYLIEMNCIFEDCDWDLLTKWISKKPPRKDDEEDDGGSGFGSVRTKPKSRIQIT